VELRQYFGFFLKWAWLILLTTALAATSSFIYSRSIRPTYRAETTVLLGRVVDNPNAPSAGVNDIQSAYNLASAYALLATQPPVLQATAEQIKWDESWQSLYFKINARAVSAQLLSITATDEDPHTAKRIADEVAHQLFLQGPIGAQQKQAEEQRTFVSAQLAQLKLQIETNQKLLANLNNQAALETNSTKLSDLNTRITAMQTKVDAWQTMYASLSTILNNTQNLFLTVLVPAGEPNTPASPNIAQNVIFAAILGLILSIAAILFLEYLDDTIKDAEGVQHILNLSTIGVITQMSGPHRGSENLVTLSQPRAPVSEGYRVLRTNLRFTGLENPSGALLITSAGPGEGKTTTATNLAIVMAQAGRRVLLVDADLRRPSVHSYMKLTNNVGLSSLFLEDGATPDQVIQPTQVEGLRVITSGPLPPNPAELLDSKQMAQILKTLRAEADMVIIDSPPVLAVADATIIGSRCSGAVLILDSGKTRTEMAKRAVERLRQTNIRLFGVVLNKLSFRRASGYYSYYYYYGSDKTQPNNKPRAAN
jgi:non-specific protein-tyrosine kinase